MRVYQILMFEETFEHYLRIPIIIEFVLPEDYFYAHWQ